MRANVMTITGLTGCLIAAGTTGARADDGQISTMQQLLSAGYNTYVSGDIGTAASAYTSDSQGAIAAGGNVYLQNFGTSTNSTANGVGLAVGGSLTMTNGSVNGTTDVSGAVKATSTGFDNVNAGGSMTYVYGQVNGSVNIDGSASFTGAGVNGKVAVGGASSFVNAAQPVVSAATPYVSPINYSATTANMEAVSTTLSSMTATAGDSFGKNAQGQYVFNSTVAGDNVFNVTSAQLAAMSGNQVVFNSSVAGATDIINVQNTGSVALPGNMSFAYAGSMTDNHVLLNLSNATTVNAASNVSYDLSILAPNATIATTGGNVTGSIFAENLTGVAQLNTSNSGGVFQGALPPIVAGKPPVTSSPAPAPMLPVGSSPLGLAVLGWFGRGRLRRRAVAAPNPAG